MLEKNTYISGWGNFPRIKTTSSRPASIRQLDMEVLSSSSSTIARGMGRSYGDSSINESQTIFSTKLNLMLSFDEDTGELVAEAGVTLVDILDTFSPRGWFLSVTPGTKFVSLGGAVASDVHGKNHHFSGSFGNHVLWFDIWTSKSGLVHCSPTENDDLFWATVGGHGLTGYITKVAIKLIRIPSLYISQTLTKAANLEEIMDIFESSHNYPYSVAWIDCLKTGKAMGRSIFMGGDFAQIEDLGKVANKAINYRPPMKLNVPFNFPALALNKFSVKLFNFLYYIKSSKSNTKSFVPYDQFFYPLDSINNWNRIYGRRGFLQYQFVLPLESSREGLNEILKRIVTLGSGSFLAVLKLFGDQEIHAGNISFPLKGYTLALDFPISKSLLDNLTEIDKVVLDFSGRFYLTKDSRLSGDVFAKSLGNSLDLFKEVKYKWDNREIFSSAQSDRLQITSGKC